MRILLAVILLAALGWAAYWFIGARAVERGLTNWFEMRADEGWVVGTGSVNTIGFPNRFDTTIRDIDLADPDTGWAWSAPFFQILALSYRPHHVIAVWPERQTIATPFQTITMTSNALRGSVVFAGGTMLRLDRATVEFTDVGLASTRDWRAVLAEGQLALRQTPATGNSYDLMFSSRDMTLPRSVTGLLARSDLVGDTVQHLSLDASVVFDAQWDRRAIEVRRPQPREIDLRLARATWGELDLMIAGQLTVDDVGMPTGNLTVKATNWREMLALARAAGVLSDRVAPLLEGGLARMARLSGNPGTLDVPLRFERGRVSLGGVLPLGPAPRLVLR
jgi:hypothetical protein